MENCKMSKNPPSRKRYRKNHIKQLRVDLNNRTDADILNHLKYISNKADYIKGLLREQINNPWGDR